MLNEDVDSSRNRKKGERKPSLLLQTPQEPPEREDSIRDDILGDKINRAKQRQSRSGNVDSRDMGSRDAMTAERKKMDRDKMIPDDSSLCEEFDKDPLGRSFAEPEKQAK
jgi:hypothetical protein